MIEYQGIPKTHVNVEMGRVKKPFQASVESDDLEIC